MLNELIQSFVDMRSVLLIVSDLIAFAYLFMSTD